MEGALKVWLVILVVGALNYLSRLSFIAVFGRRSMPAWLVRALKFVPAAVLTALILPMIVSAPTHTAIGNVNPKLLAALAAALVAFLTRSTLTTLVIGMSVLWILRWPMAAPG